MAERDAKKVAAVLTEAQRAALADGDCAYMGNDACVCQSNERYELSRLGLVTPLQPFQPWNITPLGLAVRDYLRGEQ